MKTKARKQKELEALTEQFKKAKAAMLVGFKGMTVPKDQELRNQLREAGVSYGVVKNTLARKAAEGTALEQASDHFKGVTAVALSNEDPVNLSKAIVIPKLIRNLYVQAVGLKAGCGAQLGEALPACVRKNYYQVCSC